MNTVAQELCRLVRGNYTAMFMDLQNKEMPGWQKGKERLEKVLA